MKYVVGISSYSFVYEVENNKDEIEKIITEKLKIYPKESTYRISAKVLEDHIFENKEELIKWVANVVNKNLGFRVNLKGYDIDINIKIEKDVAVMFFGKHQEEIGLPAGGNGKALTLLSGGIDSPVAAFKTITRGINSSFITFLTPTTSEEVTLTKIKTLAKKVNRYNGISQKLIFVNFERVQSEIAKLETESYRIILLRRYFVKFAKLISKKYKYNFLITGDSLGQVASQTPASMTVIDNATDQLIIRPLVSMSKNEIIKIAEKIDTYNISIGAGDDMCSTFTPKSPIIFPHKDIIEKLEKELPDMEKILYKVLDEDTRVIEIKEID